MAEKKTTEQGFNLFYKFTSYINKYGYFATIVNVFLFFVCGILTYFAVNPSVMFEKYEKYVAQKHNQSTEYRIESAPKIKLYLNQMANDLEADKTFIVEYHNGKSNPSGLQWQYGDMTFLNDEAEDVSDEYQNVSLVRYSFANELYSDGYYFGSIDEIAEVDKRLALRLEANDVKYIGAIMLYDDNLTSIGFLGVSYKDSIPDGINEQEIQKVVTKFGTTIAPLLDGNKATKE